MSDNKTLQVDVVVLGSGPGGYSAAFRAADLGLNVALVEKYSSIGGVCLNVGCIPSKALLHLVEVVEEAKHIKDSGIEFAAPSIDIDKVRASKDKVIGQLTTGLKAMAKQRKVQVVQGVGAFVSDKQLAVQQDAATTTIDFKHAVIAAGSLPVKLPFMPEDERIVDSTGALTLQGTDEKWLIIGGGIIGCEMATVYQGLGAQVSIVEFLDQLMPGADKDLVKPVHARLQDRCESIMLKTKVTAVTAKDDGLWVEFAGEQAPAEAQRYDRILLSVGRRPNGPLVAADKAGVTVDERGFIPVDKQMRTNVPHIYAIGDITNNTPMLAHAAVAEGRLAAEVIAGKNHVFDAKCVPSVAYTDPEVAWVGLTENQAKEQGVDFGTGKFPWMASGRALAMGRSEGMTKLLFCNKSKRILGAGIVGVSAGELISECALAIEMGCDVEDIALTIHPHPTVSESVMMASEMFEGTITDLYIPKKKAKK